MPRADSLWPVLLTVNAAGCSALSKNAPHAFEAAFVVVKHHLMPYCVCRATGQTGITGDKGQTGDAGEFDKDMLHITIVLQKFTAASRGKISIFFRFSLSAPTNDRAPHAWQELTHYGQCF